MMIVCASLQSSFFGDWLRCQSPAFSCTPVRQHAAARTLAGLHASRCSETQRSERDETACTAYQGLVPGLIVDGGRQTADGLRERQMPDARRQTPQSWPTIARFLAATLRLNAHFHRNRTGKTCHVFAFLSGLPIQSHSGAGSSRWVPFQGALTRQAAMAHSDRPERTLIAFRPTTHARTYHTPSQTEPNGVLFARSLISRGTQLLLGAALFTSLFFSQIGGRL